MEDPGEEAAVELHLHTAEELARAALAEDKERSAAAAAEDHSENRQRQTDGTYSPSSSSSSSSSPTAAALSRQLWLAGGGAGAGTASGGGGGRVGEADLLSAVDGGLGGGLSRVSPKGRYSYVIIGAGTTANAAVEAILQVQPHADILLLSDEVVSLIIVRVVAGMSVESSAGPDQTRSNQTVRINTHSVFFSFVFNFQLFFLFDNVLYRHD